ncbi:hypothetical protein GW7_04889 [Heterocephalus glaber]|uniref:Uncharacterized protein n=1 Tax=Heterocephalus glaber TaxID=10181 RepID=G5BUS5_HETGA|nr:hypothetical protein GW7_04889 [Heterocephalus glaber]
MRFRRLRFERVFRNGFKTCLTVEPPSPPGATAAVSRSDPTRISVLQTTRGPREAVLCSIVWTAFGGVQVWGLAGPGSQHLHEAPHKGAKYSCATRGRCARSPSEVTCSVLALRWFRRSWGGEAAWVERNQGQSPEKIPRRGRVEPYSGSFRNGFKTCLTVEPPSPPGATAAVSRSDPTRISVLQTTRGPREAVLCSIVWTAFGGVQVWGLAGPGSQHLHEAPHKGAKYSCATRGRCARSPSEVTCSVLALRWFRRSWGGEAAWVERNQGQSPEKIPPTLKAMMELPAVPGRAGLLLTLGVGRAQGGISGSTGSGGTPAWVRGVASVRSPPVFCASAATFWVPCRGDLLAQCDPGWLRSLRQL